MHKGMNYLKWTTPLSQMNAILLLYRKQRRGCSTKARRGWQLLREKPRTRIQPSTGPSTPTTTSTTTTLQIKTRRTLAVIQGFFHPKVGTLSSPLPSVVLLKNPCKTLANIFFNLHLCLSRKSWRRKKKAESMPGFTRIYAKVEKINQLSEEKLRGKDWQQICKVQKTCRYTKHLHSLPKRAKHKKTHLQNKNQ